jgi:hypothetical protein
MLGIWVFAAAHFSYEPEDEGYNDKHADDTNPDAAFYEVARELAAGERGSQHCQH